MKFNDYKSNCRKAPGESMRSIKRRERKPSPIRVIKNSSGETLTKFVLDYNEKLAHGEEVNPKVLKAKAGFNTARVYKKLAEDDLNAGLNHANGDISGD